MSKSEFTVLEPCGLLDFLLQNISGKSRNNIKSLLTHKVVLVDGKVVTKYDYPLKKGQKVSISSNKSPKQNKRLHIIYEDDEIIVINKPAGLLSVATDNETTNTAYNMLTDYIKQSHPKSRIFVVHRLDRDTSGILMFAKNERIKYALQDNWSEIVSFRGYYAIVEGNLTKKSGIITSYLKETKTRIMYSTNDENGLLAITNYIVLNKTPDFSLLDINIKTGRKNQIRVHMKDIGHSVVGDKKYGAASDTLKRLGLHAYKLEFTHPFTHKIMTFETPSPNSFTALFEK